MSFIRTLINRLMNAVNELMILKKHNYKNSMFL